MKLADNFTEAIRQIERERGVSAHSIIEVIVSALESAYKKKMVELGKLDRDSEVHVLIDAEQNNEVKISVIKTVVEEPENINQIALADAHKRFPDAEIGQEVKLETPMSSKEFEKLATLDHFQQSAEQVRCKSTLSYQLC